jgi:arginine decarboxylase
VNELAHIYCELKKLGAGLDTIDVGGGMGIDYDGSQSDVAPSVNYGVAEYAADIVYRVKSVCDARLPAPADLLGVGARDGGALVAADHRRAGQDALPEDPDLEGSRP